MSGAAREGDATFLAEALALAARGMGRASPNPMVGCVLVRDGEVVGRGFHVFADRDHAEIVALREAGERARGATAYVSLEPCSTHGRTPPCTEALLAAGVVRVVAALVDPNPRHAGAGLRSLAAAGVEVSAGGEHARAAARLNAGAFKWITTGRPYVSVKVAQSLDGRVATASGASRWITSEESRLEAHGLRLESDAIVVGVGTLLADDPRLTARVPGRGPARPARVVLDPDLRFPPGSRLLLPETPEEPAGPVVVIAREGAGRSARAEALRRGGAEVVELPLDATSPRWLDVRALVEWLGRERNATSILVEGGGITCGRFLRAGVADRLVAFVAPVVLGSEGPLPSFGGFGATELAEGVLLARWDARPVGPDLRLDAVVAGGFDPEALVSAAVTTP